LNKRLGLKGIIEKKGKGKAAVRLGRCIGKNGSRRWVGVEGDKMKKIKIYRLAIGNLPKSAKGIYKNVSNIQNLIFK
jgi:hypothetical protein